MISSLLKDGHGPDRDGLHLTDVSCLLGEAHGFLDS